MTETRHPDGAPLPMAAQPARVAASRGMEDGAVTGNLGIWEVDEATKNAQRLEETGRAGTEALLEDIFIRNPAMLMPGLRLVGRQLPAASGNLDLLGIDQDGRLVVFELKRGNLTRRAVAQALDYASWLDSQDDGELRVRICENSGQGGIAKIDGFGTPCDNDRASANSLTPVRIVLVGLGADDSARRMVDWLAANGAAIELLTFMGYRCGDRMLLARRTDDGDGAPGPERQDRIAGGRRMAAGASRLDAINARVDDYGMRDWWQEAVAVLDYKSTPSYRAKLGITFCKYGKRALSTGVEARGSHKIEIVEPGVIRIVFFPAAVDLCVEEFERLKTAVPFDCGPPGKAPVTDHVREQWFCVLNECRWQERKDSIGRLVRLVDERWRAVAEPAPS